MNIEIPDMNLFMVCKLPNAKAYSELSEEFHFDLCKRDELDIWKGFPFDDEKIALEQQGYMTQFFNNVYKPQEDLFFSNCLFVRNESGTPIATCFVWKAYNRINTLHWFKVKNEYENRGIGRAIITNLLSELSVSEYPVYLHTQPESYRAIKLYSDFGFDFITNNVVGTRKNNFAECLPILKKYMPKLEFEKLRYTSAPQEFIDATTSSDLVEF